MKEKILLALSDINLIGILSEHLLNAGFFVDYTSNGNEVMEKMKAFNPDLILIDLVLENKDGYDILNEKSFDRDVTKIPVIIVSNSGQPLRINKIPSTPTIKDYVVKSHIEPADVIEKIDKVFGRTVSSVSSSMNTDSNGGKKILWAEDDKLLSSILSKKMKAAGYVLLKAEKDTDVFKILEAETPDVIVLDILMPGKSGLDILEEIRSKSNLKNIPVIMLSNLGSQPDIQRAHTLGANKFLIKAAVSLEDILSEISTLVNKK